MKKKYGFTLIELLAVIVILGVIMLIATPIVLNIIGDSRRAAFEESARNIVRAAELEYWNNTLNGPPKSLEFKYEEGEAVSSILEFKGKNPESGSIYVTKDGEVAMAIHDGTWCAIKEYNSKMVNIEKASKDDCFIDTTIQYTDSSCFVYEDARYVESFDINYSTCVAYFSENFIYSSEEIDAICTGEELNGISLKHNFIDSDYYSFEKLEEMGIINIISDIEGVSITGYTPTCPKDVVIPDTINGRKVIIIGEWSFYSGPGSVKLELTDSENLFASAPTPFGLTSLRLPKYLKVIENDAFGGNQIKSVNIPKGVVRIENGAFWGNQLTEVIIPDTVEYLSGFGSNMLTAIEIPDSVITIGHDGFTSNQLTSVTIPSSVKYLNGFAENQITEITIPNSVKEMGETAFASNQITEVEIPNSVEYLSGFRGNQLTTIEIPSSVREIGEYAFQYNDLAEITIPSSVIKIGNYAFDSNQLTSIEIPSNVIEIGYYSFSNNQLNSLNLFNGLEKIGLYAFAHNNLTSLVFPNSVIDISVAAFAYNKLTSIIFPNNLPRINSSAFSNNQLTNVTIPNSVKSIEDNAFRYNKIEQGNFKIDNKSGTVTIRSGALSNNGPSGNTTITPTYLR